MRISPAFGKQKHFFFIFQKGNLNETGEYVNNL